MGAPRLAQGHVSVSITAICTTTRQPHLISHPRNPRGKVAEDVHPSHTRPHPIFFPGIALDSKRAYASKYEHTVAYRAGVSK